MDAEARLETVSVKAAVEGKYRITIETSFVFLEGEKNVMNGTVFCVF